LNIGTNTDERIGDLARIIRRTDGLGTDDKHPISQESMDQKATITAQK
jgi:hypothetical protein